MNGKPNNQLFVIFGASGDLTYRKLIPSVYDLYNKDLLPEKFGILGLGRTPMNNKDFQSKMKEGIIKFSNSDKKNTEKINSFLKLLSYYSFNTNKENEYPAFANHLKKLDQELKTGGNYIFYLATPPTMYSQIPVFLANNGLNDDTNGFRRLIVEKPFGYDLKSALKLNSLLQKQFREDQIFRIDHYLGKETVQNLLVTRFSNVTFEPLWNRNYIHHVEITSAEDIGIGSRGRYYDGSGALRDMVQNHLMLLVSLIAMEPPAIIKDESIRNEIVKVLQSIRPIPVDRIQDYVIRGQYISSKIRGKKIKAYREEDNVDPKSRTETFVAIKFFIDNWRWAGVPFYIRTGKYLPTKVTEIVIHFRPTPHHIFQHDSSIRQQQNQLIIRIQPDEGILLKFGMKVPGAGFKVQNVNMDFHYSDLSDTYVPNAYERLLLDAMMGDATLYSRGDAVEAAWGFIDPILQTWEQQPSITVHGYPAGTWGPDISDRLIEGEQTWRYPCKNLVNDGEFCEL